MATDIIASPTGVFKNKDLAFLCFEKIKTFIDGIKVSNSDDFKTAKELREALSTLGSFIVNAAR